MPVDKVGKFIHDHRDKPKNYKTFENAKKYNPDTDIAVYGLIKINKGEEHENKRAN